MAEFEKGKGKGKFVINKKRPVTYVSLEDIARDLNKLKNSTKLKQQILGLEEEVLKFDILDQRNKSKLTTLELMSEHYKLLNEHHGSLGSFLPNDKSSITDLTITKDKYISEINLKEFDIETLVNKNNRNVYYRIPSKSNSILLNLELLEQYNKSFKESNYDILKKQLKDNLDDINSEKISDDKKILKLVDICKTISNEINYSFLLIHDNIISNSYKIEDKNIILCSDSNDITSLKDNIVLLYFYINDEFCNLEPILIVNDTNSKFDYFISKQDFENHEILINSINILENTTNEIQHISFNSNDKDAELRLIHIELDDKRKNTYLLGNRYCENEKYYYNIYVNDDMTNDLAGKVVLISDTQLTVYWCVDHPK